MKYVTEQELVDIINSSIESMNPPMGGMKIKSLRSREGELFFNGKIFLDANGDPTDKTNKALAFYRVIAESLSRDYKLFADAA